MRLYLWFTLVVVAFIALQSTVDGGMIRRTRRLRRIGVHRHGPRSPRIMHRDRRRWPHFLAPPRGHHVRAMERSMRRPKHFHADHREDRYMHRPMPHLKRLPLMMAHGPPQQMMMSASSQVNSWRPLDFGNPIDRDPTFDYAPPSLERVRFSERPERKRKLPQKMINRENGKPRPGLFKPPRRPMSIWKQLAQKQRRRPYRRPMTPPFMRFPENPAGQVKDEAEIVPRFPNMVYFQSKDVLSTLPPRKIPLPNGQFLWIPGRPQGPQGPHGLKPGTVTNVPLYSQENQSPSQFNPVTSTTPMSTNIPKRPDDILYRPQDFMNPTRKPTILQPVYSTPVTLTATRNSVIKPIDPTESLLDIINDPPKPISGVSLLNPVNSVFGQFTPNEILQPVFHPHIIRQQPGFNPQEIIRQQPGFNPQEIIREQPVFHPQENTREQPIYNPQENTREQPVYNPQENHQDQEPVVTPNEIIREQQPAFIPSEILPEAPQVPEESLDKEYPEDVEQAEVVEIVKPKDNPEESSTVSVSTSVSTSTSVLIRAPEVSTSTTTTESSVSRSSSSSSPLYAKLPEMPTYKKRQPIYPKRYSSIKSSAERLPSSVASSRGDSNVSGEGLVITMARSKVKEYKPQFLANYTQLLTFDKVAESDDNDDEVATAIPSLTVTSAPVISSTTIKSKESASSDKKSPLQDFDPMQLLHNWFQNT